MLDLQVVFRAAGTKLDRLEPIPLQTAEPFYDDYLPARAGEPPSVFFGEGWELNGRLPFAELRQD